MMCLCIGGNDVPFMIWHDRKAWWYSRCDVRRGAAVEQLLGAI